MITPLYLTNGHYLKTWKKKQLFKIAPEQLQLQNPTLQAPSPPRKEINDDPKDSSIYFYRGSVKKKLGDLKGACEDWKKAAELGDKESAEKLNEYC